MKGGFLIGLDSGLYRRVAAALVARGGIVASDAYGEAVQITVGAGHLFTLFERVPPGTEWEVYDEPVRSASGVAVPDLLRVAACPFECRWPDLVAWVGALAARTAESPTWVLDGDGVLWAADRVDPEKLML